MRPNGDVRHLEVFSKDVVWNGRTDTQFLYNDITERRQAEEKMHEYDERYRALFDRSFDMVYVNDFEGNFIDANATALNTMGYEKSDIPNLNFKSVLNKKQLLQAMASVKEIVENGYQKELVQYRLRRKDGKYIYIETKGSLVMRNGAPYAIQGMARNITDRIEAEQSLKESERRYRDLIQGTQEIIQSIDNEGRYLFVNKAWHDILGYSTKDLKQMTLFDVIHPECMDYCSRVFQQILKGKSVGTIEAKFKAKDGRMVYVRGNATPRLKGDQVIATQGFFRDITDLKKAEEKIAKSYSTLQKTLNDAINTMAKIVEMRDPYTAGHQQRVAQLAMAIGREMKLDAVRIDQLRMAAVIHDIGKIYVPSDILSKPAKLTDQEFEIIKTHPQGGYDIIKGMEFPCAVAQTVLQHHERINGSGYPHGITADEISLEARVLAVADVVESMASHRPYRPSRGTDKALEEITQNKGILYDPEVVEVCLKLFESGNFEFE